MQTATPAVPSYTAIHYVRSRTQPHRYHAVYTRPGGTLRCDCTAAAYNRGCWHVKAVAAGYGRPATMKVEAAFLRADPEDEAIRTAHRTPTTPVPAGVIDETPAQRAARYEAGRRALRDLYDVEG